MKKYTGIILVAISIVLGNCSYGQSGADKTNLNETEFAVKINEYPDAPVIDVRTPEEFTKGHLVRARNINWNSPDFSQQVGLINKKEPVFVYCLSGGRSAAAAQSMREEGFQQVYELNGGIMKWRAANLPEVNGSAGKFAGMSQQEYDALLQVDKLVLVDFYADWCPPCKKMKPYLEEISKEYGEKVEVIRINADNHQSICKSLKIDALPVLMLYKDQQLIWKHTGFIEKQDVVSQFPE